MKLIEEEKKAIETLEIEGTENNYLEVRILLNLVDKLQEEIEKQDNKIKFFIENEIALKEMNRNQMKIIDKQQKEIEENQVLLDDMKDHRVVYIDTPEFEEKFISKDKIRAKIEEITNYTYTSIEEIECQNYARQVLKDLLEE